MPGFDVVEQTLGTNELEIHRWAENAGDEEIGTTHVVVANTPQYEITLMNIVEIAGALHHILVTVRDPAPNLGRLLVVRDGNGDGELVITEPRGIDKILKYRSCYGNKDVFEPGAQPSVSH